MYWMLCKKEMRDAMLNEDLMRGRREERMGVSGLMYSQIGDAAGYEEASCQSGAGETIKPLPPA